ncbi:MAG: hypothetical protein JW753_09115 [Dehalococcoidia bacterium]|nr:hypothetical protein [Dehalococcoidia bacterium]
MIRLIRLICGVIALLCLLVTSACINSGSTGPSTVTSANGLCQMEIPKGWSEHSDLNDEADIQVANTKEEMYIIVLSEYKEDFADDFTVNDHSELTLEYLLDSVEDVEIRSGPTEIQVNGQPALQYEIRGVVDGIKAAYLHITVDGEMAFHQVVAWTLSSRYDKNQATLQSVIDTLSECSG